MKRYRVPILCSVFQLLWIVLPALFIVVEQPSFAAAQKRSAAKKPAAKSPAAKKRAKKSPSRSAVRQAPARNVAPARRDFSAAELGIEPARTLMLGDAGQLRPLAGRFADSPTAENRRALQSFAAANAAKPAGSLAYLALGTKALDEKDFAEAASLLAAGRTKASPVPDYLDYYLARAHIEQGRHADAAAVLKDFEQLYPDSSLMAYAVLRRSEAWIATGQAQAAAGVLKSRLDALRRPEADMLLAKAWVAAGNASAAAEAYRQVYYGYPNDDVATEAGRELERLSREGSIGRPAAELLRTRADLLFRARQYRAAEQAYRELAAAAGSPERDRALVSAAASDYHGGRTSEAYRALSTLRSSDAEAEAQRLYYLAECQRRMNRDADFADTVRRLGETYPTSPWYEEALFAAGNSALLRRDFDDYERHYRAVYQRFPQGKYAPLAQWRVAWKNYRTRNFDTARQLLEEHIARYPDSSQAAAALYWLGRLAEGDNPAAAVAYFRKVTESFPNYYYSTVAREKLEHARVVPAASLPANVAAVLAAVPAPRDGLAGLPPPSDLASHRRKAEALEAAGLIDLAVIELRHRTDDPAHTQYLALELARLEHDRGRFLSALEYGRRALPNYFAMPFDALDRKVWKMLFPLPWWSTIQAEARRNGLDPYLVAALMRQESAFNAWAVSRANAYGLMQLLLPTGRSVGRKLGRRITRASLFDPVTNIQLGTRYLKDVLDRFGERLEPALASYNAGPNRADAWLASDGFEDPVEFVENIPFTETREYVQALVRNTAMYRRLYADSERRQAGAGREGPAVAQQE